MLSRTSSVNYIEINSLSASSFCQIGDSTEIHLLNKALADRRQYPFFYGREGNFDDYAIFSEPIPHGDYEPIPVQTWNEIPLIRVNRIDIKGCSFSSVIHIGSTCNVYAEARIKHIRELLNDEPSKEAETGTSNSPTSQARSGG